MQHAYILCARAVFTDYALLPLLEVDRRFVVPPLVDVAELVKLSALVVEAMGNLKNLGLYVYFRSLKAKSINTFLVSDDNAYAAVVERLREVLVIERRL